MEQHGNDKTRNAQADMLNAFQTGADRFIPQLADRLMGGQANVEFVNGRHHSSLTTGVGINDAVMVIALVSFDLVVQLSGQVVAWGHDDSFLRCQLVQPLCCACFWPLA